MTPHDPTRHDLKNEDLTAIADRTLDYYKQRAEDFWAGTRDHDVSQNIAAMLKYIGGEPPFAILDFGCGPGRDLKVFADLGHVAIGLASLFHVPSQELPRVLRELHASLKPGGVLFCSNPRGHNEEGWSGGRYGVYYDPETWRRHVSSAGFAELEHYYRPAGLPREQQPWLASVWRREPSDPA